MIRVDLPFPDKLLWPNGRTRSYRAKAGKTSSHRAWGWKAALDALQRGSVEYDPEQRIPVKIIVHARSRGVLPDADNCIAAAKAYLDGIAERLKINDRQFAAPTVEFAPERNSRFVIEVGI